MHNLHFLLVQASSAREAAQTAECLVADWGDENNWRSIGGVASEDGEDDLENVGDARWGLSDLPEGLGMAFARSLTWVRQAINDPIVLEYPPFTECPTLTDALHAVALMLKAFSPEQSKPFDLWAAARNVRHLYQTVEARRSELTEDGIVELYPWEFDHFGLTDLTNSSTGAKRYVVMLDMHS